MGWQQNEYVESWLNNAERNESRPAHKSGSRAPTDRSTALNTSAPSLPTHPPRQVPRCAISGRAAQSRAISPISGDLGAAPRHLGRSRSVARAASHLLKKEGGWRQEVTPHPERRRRRVFGPRVVARRLLRGAADHRTARRRPVRHAPPSTRLLPHERPQRRNFSLALPWAPGNADGLPVPPPAPQSPP